MADDLSYKQVVLYMIAAGRPTNMSKQHDGKLVEEYTKYCDSVYPLDPYRHGPAGGERHALVAVTFQN
jgi:hypothetical protein